MSLLSVVKSIAERGAFFMNYLKEILEFNNFAILNEMSAGQRAMWYALMSINNKCGWKEWFTAPTLVLLTESGLSESGVRKAREALVELHLIEYKSNGAKAPFYKINSLANYTEKGEIGDEDSDEVGDTSSNEVSNEVSNESSNESSNTVSNEGSDGSSIALNKQNKRKQNKTIYNNAHTRKSKFNNYEDENKTDYAALEEMILNDMLAEVT